MTKSLLRLLRIPNIFDPKSDLTSNVAVNKILSPVYFLMIFMYLFKIKKIQPIGHGVSSSSILLALISTIFYVWCSYFFQPDLDVRKMRPGMNTFPTGSTLLNSPIGLLISPIQKLIAKSWYYLWQPYASIFTHRGITHWPVIGTFIRIAYLKLIISLLGLSTLANKSMTSFKLAWGIMSFL